MSSSSREAKTEIAKTLWAIMPFAAVFGVEIQFSNFYEKHFHWAW